MFTLELHLVVIYRSYTCPFTCQRRSWRGNHLNTSCMIFWCWCAGCERGWCGALQRGRAVPDPLLCSCSHRWHLRTEGVGDAQIRRFRRGRRRRGWRWRGGGGRGRQFTAHTALLPIYLSRHLLGPTMWSWLRDHLLPDRPGRTTAHRGWPCHQTHHSASAARHQLQVSFSSPLNQNGHKS